MKWPIVGESGAYNGGHQRAQNASENVVIILIYGYSNINRLGLHIIYYKNFKQIINKIEKVKK